ncbi:uncharacterized protein E6C27_scaffold741G00320 [Cucumis melo var. makuwa]|uniref:Uncharacterized protein n=1 Tax=Cucumis melo var. makuwa TaxID=1194695 RepID=A0A5A7UMM2_CUCMM|nr:uncharacterized protein E6C27_scaffold741G00320 [Cucumis melo var. makuwa]
MLNNRLRQPLGENKSPKVKKEGIEVNYFVSDPYECINVVFSNSTFTKLVVGYSVDGQIEDDTLYKLDVDPTVVEKSIVRHVVDDFINDEDEQLSIQSRSSDGE